MHQDEAGSCPQFWCRSVVYRCPRVLACIFEALVTVSPSGLAPFRMLPT